MKTTILSTLTLATALAVGIGSGAQAAIVAGGISFSSFGNGTTYVGTNLSAATSFTFGQILNTNSSGGYTSVIGGSAATPSPATISLGTTTITPLPSFIFSSAFFAGPTSPANRFTFVPSSGIVDRSGNSSDPNTIDFRFEGKIVDSAGTLSSDSASVIISANQSGGTGNGVAFTGTLVSPSAFSSAVPEPLTMAGAGLALGLGGLIKRKSRSVK